MSSDPSAQMFRPPQLATGVPYAYAAATPPGSRLLFTAGACPLDEAGATVAVGDVVGQAERVMANLATALQEAGAGLSDVVKSTVFVASHSREDLVRAWDVVSRHLGDHAPPSTLLGVAALGFPEQLVEVEAVALLR